MPETVRKESHTDDGSSRETASYDPFVRGPFPVGVRTIEEFDTVRERLFPCEIWYPAAAPHSGQDLAVETQDVFTVLTSDAAAQPGTYPLVIFSHHSGGTRRSATFLCTHLASHGYVVAALTHSEVVASDLARKDGESSEQKSARWDAVIASRVPDVRFLLARLLTGEGLDLETKVDQGRVGIVGHSLGGWTALAAPDEERCIRAVVALAPGGASQPRPGVLPVKLTFAWGRDIPTLFLVAENDVSLPLAGMYEIFERTPATKRMVILRRADHLHFVDNVEQQHEAIRGMAWPEELAWIREEMRPISELCSGEQAHLFIRGLTLCHMDTILRQKEGARRFLAGNIKAELIARGVDAIVHNP